VITEWRRGSIKYNRPRVMGVLNMTPDSFSDKIRYTSKEATEHIFKMANEGADIIDIGGESTRPGSVPVTPEEEISRIIDVIRDAAPSLSIPVSVDTMHPETATAALDAGASMINDVSGLRDGKMIALAAFAGVPVVIMHMHGTPATMQEHTMSGDVVTQISDFFDHMLMYAQNAGMKKDKMIFDPGIGFGKAYSQNVNIINNLTAFRKGCPLLIGTSMKAFLGEAYPRMSREEASLFSAAECIRNGADIVRVHDVKRTVEIIKGRKI